MAGRYKPTHQKKKRRAKRKESSFLRTALTLCFCVLAFVFSAFLWREALRVSSQEQGSVSASGEAFRPQVGDPPYRVAIDAGHGGNDPGARGVVEEKDMTAATASVLLAWLEQDPNYIPLRTRDAFDQTATPAERAAAANAQAPQLLLSIHGNSAANGSSATGFECYPSVPGRTHGMRRVITLLRNWQRGCRTPERTCVGAAASVTFIIWKMIRSSWWRVPIPKCVQNGASHCWRM